MVNSNFKPINILKKKCSMKFQTNELIIQTSHEHLLENIPPNAIGGCWRLCET
jgi:hypothetical protein